MDSLYYFIILVLSRKERGNMNPVVIVAVVVIVVIAIIAFVARKK